MWKLVVLFQSIHGVVVVNSCIISFIVGQDMWRKALRVHFPFWDRASEFFIYNFPFLSPHFLLLLGWNCAVLKLCSCCREVTNVLLRYPWWIYSSLFLFKTELKTLQIVWTWLLKKKSADIKPLRMKYKYFSRSFLKILWHDIIECVHIYSSLHLQAVT